MSERSRLTKKPVLSVPEVAELLGWSERRCYREARRFLDTGGAEGVIPAERAGRAIRVPTGHLLARLGMTA